MLKPHRFAACAVGLVAFIFYVLTLAPSVVFIDSGELATVAATLGIAHPTGYPLFSLVGYVFTHLPIGGSAVYKANLMAGFFCAVGAGVFTLFIYYILTEFIPRKEKLPQNKIKEKAKEKVKGNQKGSAPAASPQPASSQAVSNDKTIPLIAAITGGLMLALSRTYWNQATAVEVYSLHCFLVPLTLFCLLHYCKQAPEKFYTKWGVLWAVSWGLAFTNHMTTILLIPASVYLFFATFGWNARAFKRGFAMLVPFALALALYLYLPIRASMHPVENWGNPVNWENFLRHWTGKQYQVWMFSSFDAAGKQFKYFCGAFPVEFGALGLPLFALGVWAAIKADMKTFIFTALLFVTCVLYSINYDIHDIDSYFVLAYMAAAMFCGFGAYFLLASRMPRQLAVGILAVCFLLNVAGNYKDADESGNHMVEDYALNLLNGLQPHAVVLSWQWDFFVAASIYFHNVEHVRPDVCVIDKELLRRSWYFEQMKYDYPEVYERSKPQIETFLVELRKFENDEPYNPSVIEARYRELIQSFIAQNIATRPIYATLDLEADYTKGYVRVPEGLAERLYPADTLTQVPFPQWRFRDEDVRDYYTDKIREMYLAMTTMRGQYLLQHKQYADAEKYFTYALTFAPKTAATHAIPNSNVINDVRQAEALKEKAQKLMETDTSTVAPVAALKQ